METITLKSAPAANWISQLPKGVIPNQRLWVEEELIPATSPFRAGPSFFAGRSPFRIRVMILTCFAIPEGQDDQKGSYITYVGYKKESDREFDFDEMIPSASPEDAFKTHSKACDFFGNEGVSSPKEWDGVRVPMQVPTSVNKLLS